MSDTTPDRLEARPTLLVSHWTGMPAFHQEKQRPYAELKVRFESQADLEDFCRRIAQKVTPKTKSIWHPFKSHFGDGPTTKVWVDEKDAPT